jgi:thymidylate synthase (FAD)
MNNTVKVLDHGFVTLLNAASAVPRDTTTVRDEDGVRLYQIFGAHDIDPAKTARISFNNFEQERTVEQDLSLVEYLMKNLHNTPIEMTEIWLEMKLPIFLARQFVRHRTACINEVSARYVQLPEEWYIPEIVGGKSTSGAKQGQEDNLKESVQQIFKATLNQHCKDSYYQYESFIAAGVAPEHARMFLHLNHYSHWVYKMDLHNLMHFLKLRLHEHAQIEARVYAQAILKLLIQQLPATMELFLKYNNK